MHHLGPYMRPYLRVANVFEDRIDVSDVKEMNFEPAEFERFKLHQGDVLLNEGQSPEFLGRPAIYQGTPPEVCFTNSLIRFQAAEGIDPRWALAVFRRHMHSGRFAKESRITTNIAHLSLNRLREVEFPVPPTAEQRRIADALDAHLSRLDAARDSLLRVERQLNVLASATLFEEVAAERSQSVPLGDLCWDAGYGTSAKCAYDGAGGAVLRIPNVVGGRIDLDDLKYAVAASTDLSRYQLAPGDLLIVRTNGSRDLIGRCAPVLESPAAAFASYLIRFRLDPDRVRPDWVSAVLAAGPWRSRIEAAAASSAGQYNLNLANLRALEIPLPPPPVQSEILGRIAAANDSTERLNRTVEMSAARATSLRRSLLDAAFSGRLVPQDREDEPAEVLLNRIAGEQQTFPRKRGARRPSSATP
ncbi:MAG: restriction endonuclease subunit S [Sporichthyaceae bacterium]